MNPEFPADSVLPCFYLPPISWFQKAITGKQILISGNDRYRKQQYFNRCYIKGANGVLSLSVPVQRPGNYGKLKDVQIAYGEPWQQQHWRSIQSAYGKCPFFIYMASDFEEVICSHWDSLAELNIALLNLCCRMMNLRLPVVWLADSESPQLEDWKQLRDEPKHQQHPAYFQPFGSFEPELSILDLLMNEGPAWESILKTET